MGNNNQHPKGKLILVQSNFISALKEKITQMLLSEYEVIFQPAGDLERLRQHSSDSYIISECVYKHLLEKIVRRGRCLYIKTTEDHDRYLSELESVVISIRSLSIGDAGKKRTHVDIKFVDRNVNSVTYELFLNYMKNRRLTYEACETVSDFLLSEKKSCCDYIIVSNEFANFMFNNYSKVFCFCNKNQEFDSKFSRLSDIQKTLSDQSYDNNFIRIIKRIIGKRRVSQSEVIKAPMKVVIVWRRGFDEQTYQEVARRKVQCRIITVETIMELIIFAKKSLYSTIVLYSIAQCKEVDDVLYLNHLEGRVFVLSCEGGRRNLLRNLDLHLDKGYELTPQRVQSITFLGDHSYLEKIRSLEPFFFKEKVQIEMMQLQNFLPEPQQPSVIVSSIESMSDIKSFLGKMSYACIQLSLDMEEGSDQQLTMTKRARVGKIIESLENKICYIRRSGYENPRLHRILKQIQVLQVDRSIYIDIEETDSSTQAFKYTAKMIRFAEDESVEPLKTLSNNMVQLWRLNYNPLENFRNLREDLEMCLRRLAKLKLIRVKTADFEQQYIDKLRRCESFAALIEAVWKMYIDEPMVRYCLKIVMCAIDKYIDYERIEIMKPLVFSLLCGYSGFFTKPILEPIQAKIHLQRARVAGIKVNDILTTTQFIESEECQDVTVPNKEFFLFQIDYNPVGLGIDQFYSGMRMNRSRSQFTICPYTKFLVTEIVEGMHGYVIRLKWVGDAGVRPIVQSNLYIDSTAIPDEFFARYTQFGCQQQQKAINNRYKLHRFFQLMQQKKYLMAQAALESYRQKLQVIQSNVLESAFVYLYLVRGSIQDANNYILGMKDLRNARYWRTQFQTVQKQIAKVIAREKQQCIYPSINKCKLWSVAYSGEKDSFVLRDTQCEIDLHHTTHLNLTTLQKPLYVEKQLLRVPKKSKQLFSKRPFPRGSFVPPQPVFLQPIRNIISTCFENMENVNSQITESSIGRSIMSQSQGLSGISTPATYNTNNQNNDFLKVSQSEATQSGSFANSIKWPGDSKRKRRKIVRRVYKML